MLIMGNMRVHSIRRAVFSVIAMLAIALLSLAPAQAMPRLLIDMRSGEVLFEEDAGVPWHPASLTKLMTTLLAIEAVEAGRLTLDTPVISSATALAVPPSKMGYPVDTAISLRDALYILIVKSANDIAVAVAETVAGSERAFVEMMNARAAELGMSGTRFANAHGLHDPAQVTTARDMAVLGLTLRGRYPHYDGLFVTHTVEHGPTRSHSNNNLLFNFAGADGMKTGYVCASGLNVVATAARNGRRLLAVTLGANSGRERGEMTAQMFLSGFGGGYRGTGRSLFDIPNRADVAAVDMRPLICGAGAPNFSEERELAFPAGLDGQVSYLTDTIDPIVHRMAVLGRLRDVPLPRARPDYAPSRVSSADAGMDPARASQPQGDSLAPNTIAAPVPLPRPAGL